MQKALKETKNINSEMTKIYSACMVSVIVFFSCERENNPREVNKYFPAISYSYSVFMHKHCGVISDSTKSNSDSTYLEFGGGFDKDTVRIFENDQRNIFIISTDSLTGFAHGHRIKLKNSISKFSINNGPQIQLPSDLHYPFFKIEQSSDTILVEGSCKPFLFK